MESFAAWLQASSLSGVLQGQAGWLWPVCEVLHFVGLALVVGMTGFFDLRLIGLMKRVPLTVAREFMPLAIAGFGLNLVTGVVFLVSQPQQYLVSPAWWCKVAFLLLAGANAMFFETTQGARFLSLGEDEDTPVAFKLVGATSLLAWLAVLYFGRMLPYLGHGY